MQKSDLSYLCPLSRNHQNFSKRPPRRAAIRARETVNFLHGNVENGLELRESRKALEKADQSPERPSVSESDDEVKDSSFLSNSDLYDADSGDEESKLGCQRENLIFFTFSVILDHFSQAYTIKTVSKLEQK